jgi:hypothetical protein
MRKSACWRPWRSSPRRAWRLISLRTDCGRRRTQWRRLCCQPAGWNPPVPGVRLRCRSGDRTRPPP